MAVFDDHVRVDERYDPAAAERPTLGPAAGGPAAQAGIAHTDDAAHDHECKRQHDRAIRELANGRDSAAGEGGRLAPCLSGKQAQALL